MYTLVHNNVKSSALISKLSFPSFSIDYIKEWISDIED